MPEATTVEPSARQSVPILLHSNRGDAGTDDGGEAVPIARGRYARCDLRHTYTLSIARAIVTSAHIVLSSRVSNKLQSTCLRAQTIHRVRHTRHISLSRHSSQLQSAVPDSSKNTQHAISRV